MKWPAKDIETLRKMWLQGNTATEIGVAVCKSRNAVLGMKDRLKIKRPKPEAPKKTTMQSAIIIEHKKNNSWKPKTYELAGEKIFAEHKPSLVELTSSECHYPIGDPKKTGFHFCGLPVEGKHYCVEHLKLCYNNKV